MKPMGDRNEEADFSWRTRVAATGAMAQGTGSNPNSHPVQGYTTTGGTYVPPHQQTNPNSTQTDNYGTRGNVNPYTGTGGTRTPKY
jgi:hypothetical protein